jgi:hypothetical protein
MVMVTRLIPGQRATVLQLPASGQVHAREDEAVQQRTVEPIES